MKKGVFIASALIALACLLALMAIYLGRPPLLTLTAVSWIHFTELIFWARFFGIMFALGAAILVAPRVLSLATGSIAGLLLLCELAGWGITLSTPGHFCSTYCSTLRTPAESLGGQFLSGLMLPENMQAHTHDYATILLESLVFFSVLSSFSLGRGHPSDISARPPSTSIGLLVRQKGV